MAFEIALFDEPLTLNLVVIVEFPDPIIIVADKKMRHCGNVEVGTAKSTSRYH